MIKLLKYTLLRNISINMLKVFYMLEFDISINFDL